MATRERNILITLGLLLLVSVAYLAGRHAFPRVEPRRDYLQRDTAAKIRTTMNDEDDQHKEHEDLGDESAIVREPDDDE
jgi:type II secretory pathway component PulM